MDILLLILIVLLVLSLGGWGYGYYGRPAPVADADVVAAPALGGKFLGILAVIAGRGDRADAAHQHAGARPGVLRM